MRYATIVKILFILYAVEAGIFLIMAPWSVNWDQAVIQVPADWFRAFALHPVVRSAVTGFGLVHLIWGAHDLEAWLASWRPRDRSAP